MTTTRLEITNRRLWAAVHDVFGRLPGHVRERLGRANLTLISDGEHPTLKARGAAAMCERLPGGQQRIFLSPSLAQESNERIANVVAHEALADRSQSFFAEDQCVARAISDFGKRYGSIKAGLPDSIGLIDPTIASDNYA